MVAVPTRQSRIAGVFKNKLDSWRFNMAITKHHIGPVSVTGKSVSKICKHFNRPAQEYRVGFKAISYAHHVAGSNHFGLGDWRERGRIWKIVTLQTKFVRCVSKP